MIKSCSLNKIDTLPLVSRIYNIIKSVYPRWVKGSDLRKFLKMKKSLFSQYTKKLIDDDKIVSIKMGRNKHYQLNDYEDIEG